MSRKPKVKVDNLLKMSTRNNQQNIKDKVMLTYQTINATTNNNQQI